METCASFSFAILFIHTTLKVTLQEKNRKMNQIRDEMLDLKHSPLYGFRQMNHYFPVIGEGSLDAKIVFVGEAPGETEAKIARPFCGRSGKFLDEMLASIALNREDVYITNLVKDRPQDNRDPTDEEIALYAPFLDRQLEIIKPNVVIMLGRISMKYLFMKAGVTNELLPIGKMHGRISKADFGWGEVVLLPLYHPAVALYNGSMKHMLLDDFKKVKDFI